MQHCTIQKLQPCLLSSGIDSAKPGSASTQQAFSFGFDAANIAAAPEEPKAEEPPPASSAPEATVAVQHASEHQQPPVPSQQVSALTDTLCAQYMTVLQGPTGEHAPA